MTFTAQQKALAIAPRCTAALSIGGSSFIILHVLRSPKRRRLVYHRLLLGMSVMDVIAAFKSFLGPWIVPRGTPGGFGAAGTMQTCTAAGFFGHFSYLASALYNSSLALFYLLTVTYSWNERRHKKIEPLLHVVPLLVGFGTAIAGLPLTLFNSLVTTCWIAPMPLGCKESFRYGETTCVRGDNAWLFQWIFFHAWIWLGLIFLAVCMLIVYWSVLSKEKATDKYRKGRDGQKRKTRKHSRKVAKQALLYVAAYVLTWIWNPVVYIYQLVHDERAPFSLVFLMLFLKPLQGFFNCVIYLRPRYMTFRNRYPHLSSSQILGKGLLSALKMKPIWDLNQGVFKNETAADEDFVDRSVVARSGVAISQMNSQIAADEGFVDRSAVARSGVAISQMNSQIQTIEEGDFHSPNEDTDIDFVDEEALRRESNSSTHDASMP